MIDILYTYNIQIHNKAAIFLLRVIYFVQLTEDARLVMMYQM
jgi:hypothetical protein